MSKEILPLYDSMIRLFVAGMRNAKIPVQLMSATLNIPHCSVISILPSCPLPNDAEIIRGGHRGMEVFIHAKDIPMAYALVSVMNIKDESIWEKYKISLSPSVDNIVAEVSKVISNIKLLKGNNTSIKETINTGIPALYRCMWFMKDVINGEYYSTVQEAIKDKKHATITTGPRILKIPLLTPSPELKKKLAVNLDEYRLAQFATDILDLISSRDTAIVTIKALEDKISSEYPRLIAQKESERATAEKDVERFKDRVRILERLNAQQIEEIKNLKRHPKFAGYVKASEARK